MFASILSITRENAFFGSLITLLAYMYGLVSTPLFWVLIFFSAIDFFTGIYAAWKNGNLDWDICLDGIVKKVFIGILVMVSALIDFTLMYFGINSAGLFHNFIMGTLITRELGSFIENAERAKLYVPEFIKIARQRIIDFLHANK